MIQCHIDLGVGGRSGGVDVHYNIDLDGDGAGRVGRVTIWIIDTMGVGVEYVGWLLLGVWLCLVLDGIELK